MGPESDREVTGSENGGDEALSSAPGPAGLSPPDLRRAIALYLAEAYPGGEPPASVRRRIEWPEGASLAEVLAAPRFEHSKAGEGETYALRLGNSKYPHMKMQVQEWPNEAGYMLSVNTHDQVLGLDPSAVDAGAFRALQEENQAIKEAIERAWDREGLPTFLRYLRDYLADQGGVAGSPGPATA